MLSVNVYMLRDGDFVGDWIYAKWMMMMMLKVRKTQDGGGWIVFAFSSFSPKLKNIYQKQIEFYFWSDVQN